jgi:dTDP-4-amino-4,6-dideoxygalactose transaminase
MNQPVDFQVELLCDPSAENLPVASRNGSMRFPFFDLKAQFETLRSDITNALMRVLESQHFILGPEVEHFEKEFARLVECRHAVGCASGSDALLLALMALDVRPGDEIITTPFTFTATAGAIALLGARPVFVDIEPNTYNINPGYLKAAITPKTRGIIAVHLFGLPADMHPILDLAQRHHLFVVEDAAQSVCARYQGRPVGTLGTAGCFSFFPSKNLGGAGDGGIVTTNDPAIAERVAMLRTHGCRTRYQCDAIGMNSRLDALQAAILRVKLQHVERWTAARQQNAARYQSLLAGCQALTLPFTPAGSSHVYNQFSIRTRRRDEIREYLRASGIPTEIYYPSPLHVQRGLSYLGYKPGDFPNAEAASRQVLALPIYPELKATDQDAVAEAIRNFYKEHQAERFS